MNAFQGFIFGLSNLPIKTTRIHSGADITYRNFDYEAYIEIELKLKKSYRNMSIVRLVKEVAVNQLLIQKSCFQRFFYFISKIILFLDLHL